MIRGLIKKLRREDSKIVQQPSTDMAKEETTLEDETIIIGLETTSTALNGLGDVVKMITSLFGFKTCDQCEERRKKLNRKFSFVRSSKSLGNEEIQFIRSIGNVVTLQEQIKLLTIYNELYSSKVQRCRCAGLFKAILENLLLQIENQANRASSK